MVSYIHSSMDLVGELATAAGRRPGRDPGRGGAAPGPAAPAFPRDLPPATELFTGPVTFGRRFRWLCGHRSRAGSLDCRFRGRAQHEQMRMRSGDYAAHASPERIRRVRPPLASATGSPRRARRTRSALAKS